jgi:hypothetical protein
MHQGGWKRRRLLGGGFGRCLATLGLGVAGPVGVPDDDRAAADFLPVERLNCPEAFLFGAHHDESKSTRAAGVAVENHLGRNHGSMFLKQKLEIVVGL